MFIVKSESLHVCFQTDRKPAATHLPLAWTHSTKEEHIQFMVKLDALSVKFLSKPSN